MVPFTTTHRICTGSSLSNAALSCASTLGGGIEGNPCTAPPGRSGGASDPPGVDPALGGWRGPAAPRPRSRSRSCSRSRAGAGPGPGASAHLCGGKGGGGHGGRQRGSRRTRRRGRSRDVAAPATARRRRRWRRRQRLRRRRGCRQVPQRGTRARPTRRGDGGGGDGGGGGLDDARAVARRDVGLGVGAGGGGGRAALVATARAGGGGGAQSVARAAPPQQQQHKATGCESDASVSEGPRPPRAPMTPALCDEGEAPAPAASREDVRQRSRSPARMHAHAHAHANEHLQLPTTPPLGRPRMRAHSDVQVIDALFLSPRMVVAKAGEEEERDEVEEELVVVEEEKDEKEEAAERARSLPGDLHLSTRSHSAASLAIGGGGGGGGGEGGGGAGGGDGDAAPAAPPPQQPTPPDGGWGWVVVFASFMIHIINDGVTYSFGIFYDALVTYFDSGRGETAWILSILVGVTLCSGPISSSCVNKYGCRAVTVVGGLLAAVSMALSVFAPNVQTLYLTIGLGTGLGFGLAYLPAIVSVTCYFDRLRSLATGIAVCGSGLGTFLLAPITRELVERLGWRHALLVVSVMVLSCAAFGALFRPLRAPDPPLAFDALLDADAAASETPRGRRRRSQTLSSAGSNTSLQAELRLKATPATTNLLGPVPPGDSAPLSPVTPTTALARPRSVELLALAGEKGEKLQPVHSAPARSTSGVTENTGSRGRRWARSQPTLAVSRGNHAGGVETRLASVGAASVGAAAGSGAGAWRFGGGLMRRKDILYSGSLRHLPQHKSASYLHPEAARLLTEVACLFPARATGPGDGHPQRALAGSAGDEAEERTPRRLCGCLSLSEETDAVLREMLNFSLLRNPVFLLFAVSNFLTSIGFNVPYLYVAVQAKARGVSAERAGWLLSAIGFANTVGRVALGYISDKPWVDRLLLYNVCLTVCGVATAFSALCDSYASFVVFACVFGGSIGAYVGLTSVVLVDLLGLERLTNGFGLLLLFQGIASFVGPPIAGWLYDATLSYDPGFIVAGVTMALSGLVLFVIPPMQRRLAAQQKMAEAALSAGGAGAGANGTAARTPAVA